MFSHLDRKILFAIATILVIFWFFFVWWSTREQKKFYLAQMKREAFTLYNFVVLTREWISSKGGIFVKEKDRFIKITPSHFTKELAQFAAPKHLPFSFKVAVINAQNPAHKPDDFEKEAIMHFQREGAKEYWKLYEKNPPVFKYAAPLTFQRVCFNCHGEIKNFKPPACISISLAASPFLEELDRNYYRLVWASILITILVFFTLFWLIKYLVLNPLNKFIVAAQEIEKGNFNIRVKIKTKDEWKTLSTCFNEMLDSLAKHQEMLEEKVKEATEELYQAYSELKKTEKFRSDFFSNITHELKTPVTAIRGVLELIERKGKAENKHLEIIKKNTEKLSKMIKDLLDYSKIESGQIELLKEENNINEAIEDAIFLVSPLSQQKNIKIVLENGKDLRAPFDYEKIQQVISNLLTNAIKFSPENGKIIIRTEENEKEIVVSVEDFGPGIPLEEKDKVFQKFYRVSKDKREGIGLGLAICKGIIEAHGGRIWVADPPGHSGCIFSFSIPKGEQDGRKKEK